MLFRSKELSTNNLLDLEAALATVREFGYGADGSAPALQHAAVVVKHTNPCGVAIGASIPAALTRALDADRVSAFGGIIAVNGVPLVVSGTPEHIRAICKRYAILSPGLTKKDQLANLIYRNTGLSTDDLLAVLPGACDVVEEQGMLTPPSSEEE